MGSLTCRKILQYGTSGFISHLKEGVLWIFIAIKIYCLSQVSTHNLGCNGKHTYHYITKAISSGG
jgi:hypothetical protein